MTRMPHPLPSARALFALGGLAVIAGAVPAPAAAQSGRADWRTVAGGDEVLALAADPQDPRRVWAGTEGGGVVIWDVGSESFVQHVFPAQAGLLSNDVYDIAFDASGDAWLATGRGVTFAPENGQWVGYATDDLPDDGLPDPPLTAVAVDHDGSVWAGGPYGVAMLYANSAAWTFYPVDAYRNGDDDQIKDGPGEEFISDIAVGEDGRVYFAHGRGQSGDQPVVSIYDPADRAWRHVSPAKPNATDGSPSDQVMALAVSGNTLWMATWGQGVVSWDGTTWEVYDESFGVCDDRVWAIAAAGDIVWVACGDDRGGGAGTARWDGTDWQDWTAADGLASDVVVAIAITDGRGFLGTNGTGSNREGALGGVGIIPFDDAPREPLRTAPRTPWSNDITAVAFEPDGAAVWAGTRGSGVMRYRPRDQRWEQLTVDSTDDALAGDTVTDIAVRGDEIWIASAQTQYRNGAYVDGGIGVYNYRTDRWVDLIRKPASAGEVGLPDNNVSSLAVDGSGRVWIGLGSTSGGLGTPSQSGLGLAMLDPATAQWTHYTFEHDALAGNTVMDVAAAGTAIWIGASYHSNAQSRFEGGGVSRMDGNTWTTWSRDDDGFVTYHGSGVATDKDPFIAGDVRSMAVSRAGEAFAGTFMTEPGSLIARWPFVDAVVNRRTGGGPWISTSFPNDGWVSAIAEDTRGQIWAGTTRGHFVDNGEAFQEHSPTGNRQFDTAIGGIRVGTSGGWLTIEPANSGLASSAVTALSVDPSNGHLWIGTENSGFSVYTAGEAVPTPTPGAATATPVGATPGPTSAGATSSVPAFVTVESQTTRPAATGEAGGDEGDEPEPPPEVPEPTTLMLLGSGLAGLAGYLGWRRKRR